VPAHEPNLKVNDRWLVQAVDRYDALHRRRVQAMIAGAFVNDPAVDAAIVRHLCLPVSARLVTRDGPPSQRIT